MMKPLSTEFKQLPVTAPRVRFLAALSLGYVDLKKTRDSGQHWLFTDPRTMKTFRCDSMIDRLVEGGWLVWMPDEHPVPTVLGNQILTTHGSDDLRQLRAYTT